MPSPNDHKENALFLVGGGREHITLFPRFIQTHCRLKKIKIANGQHLPCDASKSVHSDRVMHIILSYCWVNTLT